MTNSPKADDWFGRDYQLPWGWDPTGSGNTEPIAQNLVSTNRAAYTILNEVLALVRRGAAPFYQVVRYGAADYFVRPGCFRWCTSPDDYHFAASCGWISTPHGAALPVAWNLLSYIHREASASLGGPIEPLPPEPKGEMVVAELAEDTRAACPHCQIEDAATAGGRG